MSECKFTPGPWKWDGPVPEEFTDEFFAEQAPWLVREGDYPVSGQVLTGEICCRNQANLSLIAAAPEMYEALKRVMENKWEPDKYHMAVIEAIRKAEGKN